jgi:hypothetical protein
VNWSQGGSADWVALFDGRTLQGWKETPFGRHGAVEAKDGMILLGIGRQTGVTWTGDFPRTDYEVRFEAVRLEGNDFFAGITFPVKDSHCSWINGGWGGTVVGLSSLDGDDASENETSTIFEFKQGRWYAFRLEVTSDRIKGWIDGELIIDADIAGRRVELRPGESDLGVPLGFSSYWTKAGVRKIEYRRLGSAVKQEPRTGTRARAPGV